MILPDRSLWRRIFERYDAARCILDYYGSIQVVENALGSKIAEVVEEAIDFMGNPSAQTVFFNHARAAREKSFVSRTHIDFMRQWWRLMDERSELWRVVKTVPIPCARRS